MSNVLSEHTRQQVLALGRLGWSLCRIEAATGVRRETASGYLKASGVPVRGRGGRPRDWGPPKPATTPEVSTDPGALAPPGRAPRASTCEPYRELIGEALGRGRNAMRSGRIWSTTTGFRGATPVSAASSRRCAPARRWRPASSSRRPRVRNPKSIMARAPWSATRTPANTAARGSSS